MVNPSVFGRHLLYATTRAEGPGAEPINNATVIIRDGSIECVGNRQQCPLDPNISTLDATGKWLVPGFIDSHIHWQVWYDDQGNLSARNAATAAGIYLANGITTLVDVGGQRWVDGANRRVLDELQAGDQPTPRMFFSGWIDRREIEVSDSKDAGALASELLAKGAVGIKVHNGLNQQDYERIVAAADRSGHPVYGHTYYMDANGFVDLSSEAVLSTTLKTSCNNKSVPIYEGLLWPTAAIGVAEICPNPISASRHIAAIHLA